MLNIVLIFHDILKSCLVSIYLLILAISGITYGHLVTMATNAYTYNIAIWRYKNFVFSAHIP